MFWFGFWYRRTCGRGQLENVGKCWKTVRLKLTYDVMSSKNWSWSQKLTECSVGVFLLSSVVVCSRYAEFHVPMICGIVGNVDWTDVLQKKNVLLMYHLQELSLKTTTLDSFNFWPHHQFLDYVTSYTSLRRTVFRHFPTFFSWPIPHVLLYHYTNQNINFFMYH